MGNKRVFEIAKAYGVSSSDVIELLAKNHITKSNLSSLDDSDMKVVNKAYGKGANNSGRAAAAPAAHAKAAAPAKPAAAPAAQARPAAPAAHAKPAAPAAPAKPAAAPVAQVKPAAPAAPAKPAAAPAAQARPVAPAAPARPAATNSQSDRPQGGYQGNRPQGQGGYQGNRPQGDRPQGGYQGNRPQGDRPQGGYQGNRPQGDRPQGGYQGNRPQGQGGTYVGPRGQRPGGYQGDRPQGQRPQGQGGYQGNRPQGDRPQGGYQGNRPQGQGGYQGNRPQGQGGYQGNRPQGQGGYQGNRPQGQGGYQGNRPQGQGGYQGNRPQGQGGFNRGGQGGGFNKDRQGGGFNNRPGGPGGARPAAHKPAVDADIPRGKESREKYNKKKGKDTVKGSYATRDSRPNRSTTHLGRNNKRIHTGNKNEQRPEQAAAQIVRPTSVKVGDSINVKDFANLIKREVSEVIKSLFLLGVMVTINQDIDFDTAVLVGTEFDVEILPLPPEEDPTEVPEVEDDPELRVIRPPVVTVMGHVDHGKTSLLDAIRKSNVTAREAGGITQHIGAYMVNCSGKKIVFLDTPGHEAFTAMRARGAQCTDIAVLVVAADDGVMPQTIEAINHSKAAGVPIIVAINKIDKPGANPDHVKQQLAEMELIPEDWGGDTIMVPVSAHQKTGINDLLEMILLVAEVGELKANPNLPAHGTIVEAQLDKGRGPVATVLVQKGTLQVGDTIIAGTAYGKVRAMINDKGEKVRKAGPSTPVEVLGLSDVPMAGDILDATDERTARTIAEKRIAKIKAAEAQKTAKVSLEDIFSRIQEGELKELNIVVKADVQGTIEALRSSLESIKNEEVKVNVVHSGVGAIKESDVMLASAANALIIGFNVRPDANARKLAETEKVDVRSYRVIYDALNDVEAAIKGMLAPKFKETILGRVEVRQVITINKMLIAGCYVTEGKITNNSKIRIVRDSIVIAEDEMESLRRFKDDVKEVASGYECGITLVKFHDIKEGDVFEAFIMEEIAVQ